MMWGLLALRCFPRGAGGQRMVAQGTELLLPPLCQRAVVVPGWARDLILTCKVEAESGHRWQGELHHS